jgi:hypothetical protein
MKRRTVNNSIVNIGAGLLVVLGGLVFLSSNAEAQQRAEYQFWKSVGEAAAVQAINNMNIKHPRSGDFIALSNAGHSEVNGRATQAALDGLSSIVKVSRGNYSMVEIQSRAELPLWFAIFHKGSGICTYLEVDSDVIAERKWRIGRRDASIFQKLKQQTSPPKRFSRILKNPFQYSVVKFSMEMSSELLPSSMH